MEGDVADGERAGIDGHITLGETPGDGCVIGRSDLVEGQIGDHVTHMSTSGHSQGAHVGRDGRDRDPCGDGLRRGQREVLGVVMPRRAPAAGCLREGILGGIKPVGGVEFGLQLLVAGGVHVGEAGAGHQRRRRIIVLRQRDVPVPPVLIVPDQSWSRPPSRLAGGTGEVSAFTSTAAPPHC